MVGQDHDVKLRLVNVVCVGTDNTAQLNPTDLIDLLCGSETKCHLCCHINNWSVFATGICCEQLRVVLTLEVNLLRLTSIRNRCM